LLLAAASWGCTLLARRWNAGGGTVAFHGAAALALVLALGACTSLLAGPLMAGMDPTEHAYDAIVWLLLGWTALHVAVGALMQGYCIARHIAGRMTARHDIDIRNVALYWHFVALTVLVTVAVIAGFPLLADGAGP